MSSSPHLRLKNAKAAAEKHTLAFFHKFTDGRQGCPWAWFSAQLSTASQYHRSIFRRLMHNLLSGAPLPVPFKGDTPTLTTGKDATSTAWSKQPLLTGGCDSASSLKMPCATLSLLTRQLCKLQNSASKRLREGMTSDGTAP